MIDNRDIKQKLGLVASNPATTVSALEFEEESEGKSFGFLRGVRDRAINLEFRRLKERNSVSFPYCWLGPTNYDPSRGIMLVFSAEELFGVRIRGRNLNQQPEHGLSLFERGIMRHRITFIREMVDKECQSSSDHECAVQRIEIVPILPNGILQFLGLA